MEEEEEVNINLPIKTTQTASEGTLLQHKWTRTFNSIRCHRWPSTPHQLTKWWVSKTTRACNSSAMPPRSSTLPMTRSFQATESMRHSRNRIHLCNKLQSSLTSSSKANKTNSVRMTTADLTRTSLLWESSASKSSTTTSRSSSWP